MIIQPKQRPIVSAGLVGSNVLWRYLDAAKFFHLLHTRTLYLHRGDLFQDKFEGSFTASLRAQIEKAIAEHDLDITYDAFRKFIRENVFVNCWRKGTHDSMAMWSLYGGAQPSVAITTTVANLSNSLQLPMDGLVYIQKVTYTNHWRDPTLAIDPYSNVFAYKVKAYTYEQEVRILLDRATGKIERPAPKPGVSMPVDLPVLLRSIVLSPGAPEWFAELVRDMVQKSGLSTPVRRSRLEGMPI